METKREETHTWPELAIGLYDKLTGRGAAITYEFVDMEVGIPSGPSQGAGLAFWKVNGTMKIRTKDSGAAS